MPWWSWESGLLDKLIFVVVLMALVTGACSALAYPRIRGYLLATVVVIASSTIVNTIGWVLFGGLSFQEEGEGWWLALAILFVMTLLVSLPIVLVVGLAILWKRVKHAAASRGNGSGMQKGQA